MNIDNLKRVAAQAEDYSVAGQPPLYCDGNMICLTHGPMDLVEHKYGDRAAVLWAKTLAETDHGSLVFLQEMRGKFPRYYRYLKSPSVTVAVNERYRRCFDEDADFAATAIDKPVYVFEKGQLVGIVMPVLTHQRPGAPAPADDWPIIPFVDDGALYHKCREWDE